MSCVLGIETSCDETGVAIYDSRQGLIANKLYSQVDLHQTYGGVVPELASRDHIRKLIPLVSAALKESNLQPTSIQAVTYTRGPGLVGALLVGAMTAGSLAFGWGIPALGIHHIESHLLAVMLEAETPHFPFLALIVSGGHTLLVVAKKLGDYQILGSTLDDAVGEAFDKTAKLLGLGYPGGAALAKLAKQGSHGKFKFPRPMVRQAGLDFSFSGLKTYAANVIASKEGDLSSYSDIAYAFEEAVVDTLLIKCKRALKQTGLQQLVIAGGVSANERLRAQFKSVEESLGIRVFYPRLEFCTDNAAMVAYTGCQYFLQGKREDLSVEVKPRWSLESLHAMTKGSSLLCNR